MVARLPARTRTTASPDEREAARRLLKGWVGEAIKHSERSNDEVGVAAGIDARRLAKMRSERRIESPTALEIERIAKATGYPAPASLRSALKQLPTTLTEEKRSARPHRFPVALAERVVEGPTLDSPEAVKAWIRAVRESAPGPDVSQRELSERIKVSRATIIEWEKPGSGALPTLPDVQAIAVACKAPVPRVSFAIRLTRIGQANPMMVGESSSVAEEILGTGLQLASLSGDLKGAETAAQIFYARYALHGGGVSRAPVLATHFGLSEKEVVGCLARLDAARSQLHPINHRFRDLIQACSELPKMPARAAEAQLRKLLGAGLSLRGADAYGAEVLGMRLPIHLVLRDLQEPWVAAGLRPDWTEVAQRHAYSLIAKWGAARMSEVRALTEAEIGAPIAPEEFSAALAGLPDFAWLGWEEGWFWFGHDGMRNRVLEITTEMLTVVGAELPVQDALHGIRRAWLTDPAIASQAPSDDVVQAVWQRASTVAVEGNAIRLVVPSFGAAGQRTPALSRSSHLVLRALRANGGVASREAIRKHLLEFGDVRAPAVDGMIASCPWLVPLADGRFAMLGRSVS